MNKFDYCYHTHTSRCGHAVGKDEDYILDAIEAGYKEYGVSDHVILPNIIHPGMRGEPNQLEGYINSFNNLKEKYKDKINIHIGFEAEYMPQYYSYYKELLDSKKIEYLILGQHCYYEGSYCHWYVDGDPSHEIKEYTDHLIKGIESGLFKYVAHPDLFCIFYNRWDDLAIDCSKRIIEASIKHNCPLEINLCKIRAYYNGDLTEMFEHYYPIEPFWYLVSQSKARIVIGVDTHSPKHNIDTGFEYVKDMIKKYKLKVEYSYRLN